MEKSQMKVQKLGVSALLGFLLLPLVSCGDSGSSADEPKAVAADIEQACTDAADEGEVNFWKSGDEDVLQKYIEPFREKYPDIKVSLGNLHVFESAQRLIAEKQAGQEPTADLVDGDLPGLTPIFDASLGRDIPWTDYGVAGDLVTKGKDGTEVVRTVRLPGGIAYNTDQVDADELPDTWEGLLDSKWDGKMIYDPRGLYLQGLGVAWGYDKAVEWLDGLLELNPIPIPSGSQSLLSVASGEYPLTTSASGQDVLRIKDEGGPIDIKYLDVVPTLDNYMTVIKGSPHPNAAICFAAWWATPEALQVRIDLDNSFNATDPEGVPETSELLSILTTEQAEEATKFAATITEKSK
jgi:iron(III) transport system substrate-binding protein